MSFIRTILVALAIFPVIVVNSAFFPSPVGESLFIRAIITVATIAVAVLFLHSKQFKQKLFSKIKELLKNKIVLAVLAYFAIFTVSTAMATDKMISFWGNPERSEGWVGIFFFVLFFMLTLAFFEKKHWVYFARLSLVSGCILFVSASIQYLGGDFRPTGLVGNPTYLAAYFIFVIFCALFVFNDSKTKNKFFLWFSGITLMISILGIFMTGTRGAILGLAAGIFAVLFYLVFFGTGKIKKISAIFLLLLVMLSGTFFLPKKVQIWQKVPGLDRVAQISSQDSSTQSRLIMYKISTDSVNPKNEGMTKFLFGWGWDNFRIAWQKYYQPKLYFYDGAIFDRAHNKLFDVLVMNGVLGLLAYLSIWVFFFRDFLKNKKLSLIENSAIIFFTVAYFVQNLFVFDTIPSYVSFFAFLAIVIFEHNRRHE